MKESIVMSGNAELVYSNRIFCFDGKSIKITIKLTKKPEDELNLNFNFVYNDTDIPHIALDGDPSETDILSFTLTNFNSPLGAGMKKPVRIADLDDKAVYLMFSVYKNDASANPILDVSVYLEENNDKK